MPKSFARASGGFTLIELMVTVAVIAILAIVAIPNLRDFVHNNRLRAGSNEITASLQAARMEAVRLNTRALVCRSTDGTSCAGSNGTWATWVVLADVDKDGATDDVVRVGSVAPPVLISTSPAVLAGTITFGPDGIARGAGNVPLVASLGVCITDTSLPENRRVVDIRTGSRFLTRPDSASACAEPGDPT